VVVREASDDAALELALVENLQREDINPMEAAAAYQRLIHEFGLTQEKVAERVGKSRPTVANTLRLLNLPREVQESLRKGEIEEGHGKALAALEEPKLAVKAWRMVVKRKLSVQQTQTAVNVILRRNVPRGTILGGPKSGPALDPVMADLERKLTLELDARVKLRPKGKGGVMEVHYATWEELDYLVRQILSGLSLGRREARDHVDER
jgi:ParB family chromosome partitioning protein